MARHRAGYSGERLTAALSLKMTPSERAELERRAALSGLHVSDYARRRVLGGAAPKPMPGRDPRAVRKLAAEIAAVGNNLNQLARVANTTGKIRAERALEALMDQIADAMARVIEL
jgi:hypothetical protein